MDPLSDVFRTLRIRSTVYFRTALGAPWGLAVPAHEQVARFHLVLDGGCTIALRDEPPLRLGPGDLAMVPAGAPHVLRSDDRAPVAALPDVLDETAYDGHQELVYGGPGPRTAMVCGHFAIEDRVAHPVIDLLPPLVHIRASDGHDFTWLDAATRTIGRESAQRLPGWRVVVDRACEILFVQVLRLQLSQPSQRPAAYLDEHLSRALHALHEDPARDWDLERLAREAGMSRTTFAVRFRELMGMPPMTYVTRWRLQKARLALIETHDSVAAIAERAGYTSEAGFARAFQRLYGESPAAHRQAERTGADDRTNGRTLPGESPRDRPEREANSESLPGSA